MSNAGLAPLASVLRAGGASAAIFAALMCSASCSSSDAGDSSAALPVAESPAEAGGGVHVSGRSDPRAVFVPASAKGWPRAEADKCADLKALEGPEALYLVGEVSDTCMGLVPGGQVAVFAGPEASSPDDTTVGREIDDGRFVVRRVLPSMSSAQTAAVEVAETGSHLLIVHRGGAEQSRSLDDLISALGDR